MPRLASGQQLGEYKLTKLLGEGTFAEVWLCEKTTDITTRFALKVPSPVDKHGRPNGVDMSKVKLEAISWAAASDPGHINVVPIIEAKELQLVDSHGQPITDPVGPFFTIVTEYCAGGCLSDWLKQHGGKAPLAQAFSIIRGVADGLVHLHSRGLIHRDIKPANVMMLGNTPRIADFGLVRGVDQTVTLGADGLPVAAGSPAYMSPEALNGDRHEDVDVWALGILSYELLQGSRPRTVTDSGPVPPLDDAIPEHIQELFLKLFLSQRDMRVRNAQQFINALLSFPANQPQSNLQSETDSAPGLRGFRDRSIAKQSDQRRLRDLVTQIVCGHTPNQVTSRGQVFVVGDRFPIPDFEWITVMNPEGVSNDNGFDEFMGSCSINEEGEAVIVGFREKENGIWEALCRFATVAPRAGAQCGNGVLFFYSL